MSLQEEIKKINEKIEALNKDMQSLMSELDAGVENDFPQDGEEYWYIDDEGIVYCTVYENHQIDNHRQSIGNFFQTEEQAVLAVEKLKVEAELRKFSKPFDTDSLTFTICFDVEENELYSETRRFMNQGSIYFGWGQAEEAMDAVGRERIKKYIFGVED